MSESKVIYYFRLVCLFGLLWLLSAELIYLIVGVNDFERLQSVLGIPVKWLPLLLDRHLWIEYMFLGLLTGTFLFFSIRIIFNKTQGAIIGCGFFSILTAIFLLCSLYVIANSSFSSGHSVHANHPSNQNVSVEARLNGIQMHEIRYHAILIQPGLNRRIGEIPNPYAALGESSNEVGNEEDSKVAFTWSADGNLLVVARYGWYVAAWDFDNECQWITIASSMPEIRKSHLRLKRFLEGTMNFNEFNGDVDVHLRRLLFCRD